MTGAEGDGFSMFCIMIGAGGTSAGGFGSTVGTRVVVVVESVVTVGTSGTTDMS